MGSRRCCSEKGVGRKKEGVDTNLDQEGKKHDEITERSLQQPKTAIIIKFMFLQLRGNVGSVRYAGKNLRMERKPQRGLVQTSLLFFPTFAQQLFPQINRSIFFGFRPKVE